MNRAIFLDRDGTVIRDFGYIRDPTAIEPVPGAVEALRDLCAAGWRLIVVTNQSGVGRGLISFDEMQEVERAFEEMMRDSGAPVVACYSCTHAPEQNCECRKPSPSLLREAARMNDIDLRQSWMIGDRESDILCGRNAGCSTIWIENDIHAMNRGLPDFIAANWQEIEHTIKRGAMRSAEPALSDGRSTSIRSPGP